MLRIVGLGLSIDSLSIGNLKKLILCDKVVFDTYTNIWFPHLQLLINALKCIGRDVILANREFLEGKEIERIIEEAKKEDICIAVAGDPLIATTHSAIIVEAMKRGVEVEVAPASSILNVAVSFSCLQVYRFGKIVTVVRPKNGIIYDYPLMVIKTNRQLNLHTLLLLEIDVEKNYYMKPDEAIKILIDIQKRYGEEVLSKDDTIVIIGDALSC